MIPPLSLLPDTIPFSPALDLDVDVPVDDIGRTDVYIDDIIVAAPLSKHFSKVINCVPRTLYILGRTIQDDEPLPYDILLVLTKLLGEGTPAEICIVLGWLINT